MKHPCSLYRCWSASGDLLYVGCSPNPLRRIYAHCGEKVWATEIANVTIEWLKDKTEASTAEKRAIRDERPRWNVHHNESPVHCVGRYHPAYDWCDPETWAIPPTQTGAAK